MLVIVACCLPGLNTVKMHVAATRKLLQTCSCPSQIGGFPVLSSSATINIPTISNMFIRCNLSKIYGLATHIFMVNGHVVSVVSISFNICEMDQNFDLCENKLISAFVFTTQTVQFIFFLNLKFKASGHLQAGLYWTWSETM